MSVWSMVLAFAPWIAFKLILLLPIAEELLVVKIKAGISAAALICAYRIFRGLDRGVIAWGSGLFFGLSMLMVVGLTNIWYMFHLGVFANGTLAVLAWFSLLKGEPFTLAYAKQVVGPEFWDKPRFIHKNYRITAAWACSFSLALLDAMLRLQVPDLPWYYSELFDDAVMAAAVWFTMHLSHAPAQNQAVQTTE